MTAVTVNIDAVFPAGRVRGPREVLVVLVDGGAGSTTGNGKLISDTEHVRLSATGTASVVLQRNSEITPAGTFYRLTVAGASPKAQRLIQLTALTPSTVGWDDASIQVYSPAPVGSGTVGPAGPTGATGPAGAAGPGVPVGGTTGQVLSKSSATDYDTAWTAGGGGAPTGPAGGDLGGTYPNPTVPALAGLQPLDSDLTAIAALATTAYGRSVLALVDAAGGRTLFGAEVAGAAAAAQAASQPLDSDLTAIAALTSTAYGRSFLALVDAAGGRTLLGLGTVATQNANAVSISGGTVTGITDLAIADGGTGASTAALARTGLGVDAAGTDNSTNVTLAGTPNYITIAAQTITRALIDLASHVTGLLGLGNGGTGASTAAGARTNLVVDVAGTDNSTNVTLAGTPNYITIAGQVITRALVNLTSHVTGLLPVANGGTGASTAKDARANLEVDKRTTFSNVAYTVLASDKVVSQIGTMSASRVVTLPAASTTNAGKEFVIEDRSGTVTATFTLVVTRAGADTIDGGTTWTIGTARGMVRLVSDGTSAWSVVGASLGKQHTNAVSITGGTITGITDITVADGGTNASTAAGARTNLGAEDVANKSNVTTLGTSATLYPTQNAAKVYTDTTVSALPTLTAGVQTTVNTGTPGLVGVDVTAANIQDFTSGSGTWTKPANCTGVYVLAIGGGGGGGSGRKGAEGSARFGGSGGAPGGSIGIWIPASSLGATVAYTVGAGGAGGLARTGTNEDGVAGTSGGNTTFGPVSAGGGGAGFGGAATGAGGGAIPGTSNFVQKGADSTANSVFTFSGGSGHSGSGGAGGYRTAANSNCWTGGAGGAGTGGVGGTAGSASNGGAGGAGSSGLGGGGGGGGGDAIGGAGGGVKYNGGNGGALGGGGGGGTNGVNAVSDSGDGGAGGVGFLRVISIR